MIYKKVSCSARLFCFLISLTFLILIEISHAKSVESKENLKETQSITQAELQSELMSFADRFIVILAQALDNFTMQNPTPEARQIALDDTVHTSSAVFTIASEPNPGVSLLDMIVLTTLGRMIYEEHYLVTFGQSTKEMVKGFRLLEEDIWNIAKKVISLEDQQKLKDLITTWRRTHPEQLLFTYIRFGDFAASRKESTLVKAVKSGGMFASIKEATTEVEQTRLIAERAIFLASRLPLLAGPFSEVWLYKLTMNPEIQKAQEDFHTFSSASERLVSVVEKLPSQISENSKDLIKELESKEKQIHNLLKELQQTMAVADNLTSSINKTIQSADSFMEKMNAPSETGVKDYEAVANTVAVAAQSINASLEAAEQFLSSSNFEKPVPPLIKLTDQLEIEAEEIITHGFIYAVALILIFFFCMFVYRYAVKKIL